MRLQRLYLEDYRVLRDLEIQFYPSIAQDDSRQSYSLDFLVGLNGSGKSTVLQAIVDIFMRMERNAPIPFTFELEYQLGRGDQKRNIMLTNRKDETQNDISPKEVMTIINGNKASFSNKELPSSIITFTSGDETQWLGLGKPELEELPDLLVLEDMSPVDKAISELPAVIRPEKYSEQGRESEESRFFLIQGFHIPIITLCGLLEFIVNESSNSAHGGLRPILDHSGLSRFCGFSLRFRLNEGIIFHNQRDSIIRISQFATHALHLGSDRLLIFDLNKDGGTKAKRFLVGVGGSFKLFKILSDMQYELNSAENPLQEINIFLERKNEDKNQKQPLHLFDWLSDGEKSFLGRMCLFNVLAQEDALILLDEPEVHFNDYWKRQIVSMIDNVLQGQNIHVLISTHSSITLTDVPREDILVLERTGSHTNIAKSPRVATLAADPSDIMVHVFGTPYAAGQRAVDLLLRTLEGDKTPQIRSRELNRLLDQVGPGYWSYRIRKALLASEGRA